MLKSKLIEIQQRRQVKPQLTEEISWNIYFCKHAKKKREKTRCKVHQLQNNLHAITN